MDLTKGAGRLENKVQAEVKHKGSRSKSKNSRREHRQSSVPGDKKKIHRIQKIQIKETTTKERRGD